MTDKEREIRDAMLDSERAAMGLKELGMLTVEAEMKVLAARNRLQMLIQELIVVSNKPVKAAVQPLDQPLDRPAEAY